MRSNESDATHGDFPKGGSYTSNGTCLLEGGDFYEKLCREVVEDRGNRVAHHPCCSCDRCVGWAGDTVIREAQEAVTATKDYTIQQKDAFQRKIQTELEEVQVRITQLRGQVEHASGEARADIQTSIGELEKKKQLVNKKAEAIHSATASSWEQVKSKTAAAMDDLRKSLKRALSHLPSR